MEKMLTLLIAILGLTVITCAQSPSRLDPAAFKAETEKTKALVIDVRTPEEYAKGHLDAARNIDWLDDGFMAQVAKLDHKAPVLLYCAAGGRSEEAVEAMRKAGFTNVRDMQGGFNAWKAKGLPVAK